MTQVVVLHGGDSFSSHDAYLAFLRDFTIENLDYLKRKPDWRARLPEVLGSEYEVLAPQMPNKWNARYAEWKLWFEKFLLFFNDGVILVGHSLGASFLTRYLAENDFPVRIEATFLVAGVYSSDVEGMTEEFAAPASLARLAEQGGKIFLYHSVDDPVVPFSELGKYQVALPHAIARSFTDRQHFNQESFPELVADIHNL